MKEFPPLLDEIIVAGARAVISAIHRKNIRSIDLTERATRAHERTSRLREVAHDVVRRIQIGGAVVEYLDKMMVGGRALGDCSRTDLEKEANSLHGRGTALLDQASLLRSIAPYVEAGETVRTAAKRACILDVLRQHYS